VPAEMPPDNRSAVERYLDDVAPASMVGRQIRVIKDAMFVTPDDGATIPDNVDFVALCDQTMVGRIRFNGEGNPPDYRMGLLYDNFTPPRDGSAGSGRVHMGARPGRPAARPLGALHVSGSAARRHRGNAVPLAIC
jgi:hypothetical protein